MWFKSKHADRAWLSGAARHPALLCCVLSILCLCPGSVYAANEGTPGENSTASDKQTSIILEGGRLSVAAQHIPLVELLRLIGAQAGFAVVAYGDFASQTVSPSFSDLPLEEAVRKLLRGMSTIVTYRGERDRKAEPAISTIYLLGTGQNKANPVSVEMVEPGLDNQRRIDQVESSDVQDRLAAIERTAGLSDEITLEDLRFSLSHDTDPEVRIRAVTALEGVGGPRAVTALEAGIGDDDPAVRKKVVQALGKIDDERIPLWLGQVLMGDPEAEVRLEAVRSLAHKDSDIAKAFLEAATGDLSSLVNEAAALELQQ